MYYNILTNKIFLTAFLCNFLNWFCITFSLKNLFILLKMSLKNLLLLLLWKKECSGKLYFLSINNIIASVRDDSGTQILLKYKVFYFKAHIYTFAYMFNQLCSGISHNFIIFCSTYWGANRW